MKRDQKEVVLVGTGNLAWHLGHALVQSGIRVSRVLGRSGPAAGKLAGEIGAGGTGRPENLDKEDAICLVCISDDAIIPVAEQLKPGDCLVLHTAGSVPMDVFEGRARNYGVFYPFMTFTKGHPVSFRDIPLLIEANTAGNLETVRKLALELSGKVIEADSQRRMYLHLAAVFAANFSNHMFSLAEIIALDHNLPFDLLEPLIREMTRKALSMSPRNAQTGPAVRRNHGVMEKHLELLKDYPKLQQIYRLISDSIMNPAWDKGAGHNMP